MWPPVLCRTQAALQHSSQTLISDNLSNPVRCSSCPSHADSCCSMPAHEQHGPCYAIEQHRKRSQPPAIPPAGSTLFDAHASAMLSLWEKQPEPRDSAGRGSWQKSLVGHLVHEAVEGLLGVGAPPHAVLLSSQHQGTPGPHVARFARGCLLITPIPFQ